MRQSNFSNRIERVSHFVYRRGLWGVAVAYLHVAVGCWGGGPNTNLGAFRVDMAWLSVTITSRTLRSSLTTWLTAPFDYEGAVAACSYQEKNDGRNTCHDLVRGTSRLRVSHAHPHRALAIHGAPTWAL